MSLSNRTGIAGPVIGASCFSRDAKDDVVPLPVDLPRHERAALPLSGGEFLQFAAYAGLQRVANFKQMTAEPRDGVASRG